MFRTKLTHAAAATQSLLATRLAGYDQTAAIAPAMAYTTAGGKGLRGFLVIESAALYGVAGNGPVVAGAAVEALHAYSLVHDDLPCMDDDDLRRGQPTVHKAWDEATAVLVGDALQSLAFELLASPDCSDDPAIRCALVARLARAAGGRGMVLGQAMDMAAETAPAPLTLDEITTLQSHKTGALMEWSATAGAVLAGADPAPLLQYSQALGLAFQIADDILDVEGSAQAMGKAVGKDATAGKATFVSLLGLGPAKARAQALADAACDALAPYGAAADTLKDAAQFVVSRKT